MLSHTSLCGALRISLRLQTGASAAAIKTNRLVMSAGGFRFTNLLRVGVTLTLIMWVTLSWLLVGLYEQG